MAESTGLDSLLSAGNIPDTVLFVPYGDEQIRVDIRKGQIDHIGLSLFPDSLRESPAVTAPFEYLERTVLLRRLPLCEDIKWERDDRSRNVIFTGTSPDSLPSIARKAKNVTVNFIDNKIYTVVWRIDSAQSASVNIPADYSLLKGTSLPENERTLLDNLLKADTQLARVRSIGRYKGNVFIIKGRSVYFNPADTTSESVFQRLFDGAYPVNNFIYLLKELNIPGDFKMDVRSVVYPNNLETVNLRLSTITDYFLSNGCEIFTIPVEISDSRTQFWMLFRNIPLGYFHSLKVTLSSGSDGTPGPVAGATLATFIPINKIRNLFADQKAQ